METTSVNLYLKTAAKSLWAKRDFFVEDGNYDIVLECLVKLSGEKEQDCVAALDEFLSEDIYN